MVEGAERAIKKACLEMLSKNTGFNLEACELPSVAGSELTLRCPKAIAIQLKRRFLADTNFGEEFMKSAKKLYGSELFFLQTENNKAVYATSLEGESRANSLLKKQEKMITANPNSILPEVNDQAALISSILWSPELLTLVAEETQQPVVVSQGYAQWTGRSLLEWLSPNNGNERRWANGELAKMQELLEQQPGQILREYSYPANYCGDGDRPYTFVTSFQRIRIPGAGWFRFARVHGATPATVYQ